MSTATITSKGQITVPADVRMALNIDARDRVEFLEIQPGRFEVIAATWSVREVKGMFGKAARRVVDRRNEWCHRGQRCLGRMIGLDANVLVRYIMQDDPAQSRKATRLIEPVTDEQPGFVSIVASMELVRVLLSSYELTRLQVASAVGPLA